MRLTTAVLLGLCLLSSAPATYAQTPPAAAAASDTAWQAWVQRFADNLAQSNQRVSEALAKLRPIQADLGSPVKMKAHLPAVRGLLAVVKADLNRSRAELVALAASAPPLPPGIPLSSEKIASDALSQADAALRLISTMDQAMAAAAVGDRPTLRRLLPDVVGGGVLLVDNQAAIYRARRDAFTKFPAPRATMGLMASFYAAMAETMRIAVYGQPPFNADLGIPIRNLATLAQAARTWSDVGDAEANRELAMFVAMLPAPAAPADAARIEEMKKIYAGYGQVFSFGRALSDQISAIHGNMGKGRDAAAAVAGLTQLTAMEQQVVTMMQSVQAAGRDALAVR